MRKIECDFCGKTIADEKNIWYFQFPFFQQRKIMVSGKEVGRFPGQLDYKIMEICPDCAAALAKALDEELKSFGVEI